MNLVTSSSQALCVGIGDQGVQLCKKYRNISDRNLKHP